MFLSMLILGLYAGLGLTMVLASFWSFRGDTIPIITAVIALLSWGAQLTYTIISMVRVGRGEAAAPKIARISKWTFILAVLTGTVFMVGVMVTCGSPTSQWAYHWGGLLGSIFAMVVLVSQELTSGDFKAGRFVVRTAVAYGLWGLGWLIFWLIARGEISGNYIAQATSPYRLPYPSGVSSWVVQGPEGGLSHSGDIAWDFVLACGTEVVAARDGTIVQPLRQGNSRPFDRDPDNIVVVDHGDGTRARYNHIEQGSAMVTLGQTVTQGTPLARVGTVGSSSMGHIHFEVVGTANLIRVAFNDVDGDGIPRLFRWYRSDN